MVFSRPHDKFKLITEKRKFVIGVTVWFANGSTAQKFMFLEIV